jgi:hypothetical protein
VIPIKISLIGTYPWSFVTQIFHNGQPSHSVDRTIFEVMTSTLPKGTLGSVASLSAATLYQGNLDRNHELWNIVSSERYILHMQVLLECCQKYTVHLFFYNYIYFHTLLNKKMFLPGLVQTL